MLKVKISKNCIYKNIATLSIAIFFLFTLNGCDLHLPKKTKHSAIELVDDVKLESLQKNAQYFLNKNDYKNASDLLESIRAVYPYTYESEWAMINLINIYNARKKYDELIFVSDQFLQQVNANHDKRQYVAFLYANAHFNKMGKKARNIENIKEAIEVLEWFIEEFGENAKYSKDVLVKLDTANGKLIFRELEIGNFYEKKRNFIAALKRYLNANEISKKNIYTSEIIYRIFYCYVNLGLNSDADIYYQILQNEYMGSDFANLAKELKTNINFSKIS